MLSSYLLNISSYPNHYTTTNVLNALILHKTSKEESTLWCLANGLGPLNYLLIIADVSVI